MREIKAQCTYLYEFYASRAGRSHGGLRFGGCSCGSLCSCRCCGDRWRGLSRVNATDWEAIPYSQWRISSLDYLGPFLLVFYGPFSEFQGYRYLVPEGLVSIECIMILTLEAGAGVSRPSRALLASSSLILTCISYSFFACRSFRNLIASERLLGSNW